MSNEHQKEVLQFLAGESIFGNVGQSALERLAALGQFRDVSTGDSLFRAGQSCEALHFLVVGQARVILLSPDGRERTLHLVLPGDMVGAVAFFDCMVYPCSVIADLDCRFLMFHRCDLLQLLTEEGEVTLSLLGGLVARQRKIVGHLEKLSFEDTSSRLWSYLLENSQPAVDGYPRCVEHLPTREKIAGAIGTVREVVSRRLSQLIKSGHISIEGRKLILHKPIS